MTVGCLRVGISFYPRWPQNVRMSASAGDATIGPVATEPSSLPHEV